jgi:DNA-directed RNA polymerase-3 subunit RPC5
VEVDIPINIRQNYNKPQGVRWGEALRKTKGFGQKAYGTAAGFERVMPRLSTRPGADAPAMNTVDNDDNIDEYITNFEDANEKGHVLNTQTFGGQIMKDEGSAPSYMVGTFRNGTHSIQFRPTYILTCDRPITSDQTHRPCTNANRVPLS